MVGIDAGFTHISTENDTVDRTELESIRRPLYGTVDPSAAPNANASSPSTAPEAPSDGAPATVTSYLSLIHI